MNSWHKNRKSNAIRTLDDYYLKKDRFIHILLKEKMEGNFKIQIGHLEFDSLDDKTLIWFTQEPLKFVIVFWI